MMNLAKYGLRAILILIGLVPAVAGAVLTVIYDSGDTRPIAPFLEAFESKEISLPKRQIKKPQQLGAADIVSLLPIRSPGLTPGIALFENHDRPFSQPFFLIGSDDMSKQWLLEYRGKLKEVGAVGMLVQAETKEDLRSIAELADGLSIMPASGTDIAEALKISHYPVLITAHGIEQ
jgi:integrating conjugative element protein (TIGR03765 family)